MSTTIILADHVQESDLARIGPESAISCLNEYDDNADRIMWNVVADDRTVTQFDDDRGAEAAQITAALTELRDKIAARRDLIGGIRDLADFLEQHPEVQADYVSANSYKYDMTADDFRAGVEALRELGAIPRMSDDDKSVVTVEHRFGPVRLLLEVRASAVCEMQEVQALRPVLPDWARPVGQSETLAEAA